MAYIKNTLMTALLLLFFSCSEKKEQVISEETVIEVDSIRKTPLEEKIFKWDTELCTNEGTYDAQKYTEAELEATRKLWWELSGYINLDVLPRNDDDLIVATIESLDKEYDEALQRFENLKIINEPYWVELKKSKLRELNESYELKKIAIQAFNDPQVFMENRFADHCKEYAVALSSMDEELLLSTWKKMVEKQMEKNGSPEMVLAKFNNQNDSSKRLIYARNQVMTYGWWNCANHVIYHFNNDGRPEKEFNKLFKNVKSECDEP